MLRCTSIKSTGREKKAMTKFVPRRTSSAELFSSVSDMGTSELNPLSEFEMLSLPLLAVLPIGGPLAAPALLSSSKLDCPPSRDECPRDLDTDSPKFSFFLAANSSLRAFHSRSESAVFCLTSCQFWRENSSSSRSLARICRFSLSSALLSN